MEQQVYAYYGCYDIGYDGGNFNYNEGYFERRGDQMF